MGTEQVQCNNCGALMSPPADGRTYACSYCRAETLVAVDAAQIATGMRLDLANADGFLTQLADALSTAFAERTKVHADSGRIVHLEVTFEKDMYVAKRDLDGIVAQHKKMVRGVALKTVTHPLERWVALLTTSIAAHANANAHAAKVLAMLGDDGSRRS